MTTPDLADIPPAWSPSRKLGCALGRLRRPGLDIETRDALQLVVEKARREIAGEELDATGGASAGRREARKRFGTTTK